MAWKKVGKVKEAHGLKGELWIIVFSKSWGWLEDIETFALGQGEDGIDQEYTLEKGRPASGGLVIRAKELTNRNQSEALINQFFYIPVADDAAEATSDLPEHLRAVEGFVVFDGDARLGPIQSFASNGPQDLLVVALEDGTTVDIPFVDAFIKERKPDRRELIMQLPEGLLEINRRES